MNLALDQLQAKTNQGRFERFEYEALQLPQLLTGQEEPQSAEKFDPYEPIIQLSFVPVEQHHVRRETMKKTIALF